MHYVVLYPQNGNHIVCDILHPVYLCCIADTYTKLEVQHQ